MSTSTAVPFEAISVDFHYGPLQVLKGLAMAVSRGEIFGVLGANGAGKTTLMRLLIGRIKPSAGEVLVFGEPASTKQAQYIGYMPQLNALYAELSVLQNIDFFARMYGMSGRQERREAVQRVMEWVELSEKRSEPLSSLSGGMRQRVSLAVAMVHQPPLLILDEPTVGLDPELRANFWGRFREMAGTGTTLIISSHTMDDAAHCDRLAFIQEGRVVAQGDPEALRNAVDKPGATLEDAFLYFIRGGRMPGETL
ncbi:MAG: ABC transporter ATP-binding protein [Chloroflexi bacterium]|nr:ABC transporter ATP-binding protein [Chloroflexota bacterium]